MLLLSTTLGGRGVAAQSAVNAVGVKGRRVVKGVGVVINGQVRLIFALSFLNAQ